MYRPMLIAAALASVPTAALAGETITYSYDARGRLVQVAHAGSVNDGLVSSYAFDKADNRTSVTVSGSQTSTPPSSPPTGATNASGCIAVVPLGGKFRVIPCAPAT